MKTSASRQTTRLWILAVCFVSAVTVLTVLQTSGLAKGKEMKKSQKEAFALYQSKCLGCHDSVADPEKAGRTRDDWHLVVNIMHGYGMELTADEGDSIVDLLYSLRRGIERDPG